MSTFGGVYFTNKGRALQAKGLTGKAINFTRLAAGDGSLTTQVIADLIALVHEVESISITTLKNTQDGKVTVGGVLSNQGLTTGFYWREIGLFATDPDLGEILYCYGNAAALAEYIPAGGGADLLEKQVNVIAVIGNATSISAVIDSSLVYESVITGTGNVTDFWSGNKTFRNLATDVRAVILNGLSTATNAVINATDTILSALGKLQKQITDNASTVTTHLADYVRQPGYGVTTGGTTAYVVTLTPAPTSYVDGMGIAIKINATNTGASTINVNSLGAKTLKDPVGSDFASGTLLINKIYSFKYDSVSGNFIQQGRGGDANLVTGNIKNGVSIYGIAGKSTVVDCSDTTITNWNQLLAGIYAHGQDGVLKPGTMANNSSPTSTITTQGGTVTIPAGYNPGGTVTANLTPHTNSLGTQYGAGTEGQISIFPQAGYWDTTQITYLTDANYKASNILGGTSIFGLAGGIPIATNSLGTQFSSGSATQLSIFPTAGYYGGNTITYLLDANYVASNIISGKSIFGLTGTAKRTASGSGTTNASSQLIVSGLSFQPRIIIMINSGTRWVLDATLNANTLYLLVGTNAMTGSSVNSSGFILATAWASTALSWEAWE